MKTKMILMLIAGVLLINKATAQQAPQVNEIVLKEKSDFKVAEPKVKEAAEYILNSPITLLKTDLNRLYSIQFLMKWVEGTPDYTFNLNSSVTKLTESNNSLLTIYLASMVNYVLDNPTRAANEKEVDLNAFIGVLKYCEIPSNGVKLDKNLNKLIDDMNKDTLKDKI